MRTPSFEIALVERPHTAALGTPPIEGFNLDVIFAPFDEVRQGFLGKGLWDAAEMPLGRYIALKAAGQDALTAIPVFPWRSFRHGAIHVRADGSIRHPTDLHGRRVGVTDWHQTAGIVARGILAREFAVDLQAIEWVAGGLDSPPRENVAPVPDPRGFAVSHSDRSLASLLSSGEIDAIIAADPPTSATLPVTRLLENSDGLEEASFASTGIFPLMHTVAIRRGALDTQPAARSLEKLFTAAMSRSPVAGDPKWQYGLRRNLVAIERLLEDAFQQGIGLRRLEPAELFLPGLE